MKFIDTIRDCFLYQHIIEPTRSRGGDDPSTIDLPFKNEEMQISTLEHHAPSKSDHSVIAFYYISHMAPISLTSRYLS